MTQYHVYRDPDGNMVIDLQTDLVDTATRVVAPLRPSGDPADGRTRTLKPRFEIEGDSYTLHTNELAAVSSTLLDGEPVADLSEHDYTIVRAVDYLFRGS